MAAIDERDTGCTVWYSNGNRVTLVMYEYDVPREFRYGTIVEYKQDYIDMFMWTARKRIGITANDKILYRYGTENVLFSVEKATNNLWNIWTIVWDQ